jgi:hypothetical protein
VATLFALVGHFNSDNKTLVACGLYILGGKQYSPLYICIYHVYIRIYHVYIPEECGYYYYC